MPHFGLMDESVMSREAAARLRAQLHLRGGRRRLRQTKFAAGVAALYDALCSGMRGYILLAEESSLLQLKAKVDCCTDRELFLALVQAGILDNPKAFESLESLLEQLLKGLTPAFDQRGVVALIEHWLTRLGIMPFDEDALPSEDPNTF